MVCSLLIHCIICMLNFSYSKITWNTDPGILFYLLNKKIMEENFNKKEIIGLLKSHMVHLLKNFSPVNLTKSRPLRQGQYGIILACLLTKQELLSNFERYVWNKER